MIRWFSGREVSMSGRRDVFKLELNATEFRENMPKIGATPGWVFVAICTFMDKEGYCFPSQKKLCELTGLSRNTVSEAIRSLCSTKLGDPQRCLLVKIREKGKDGRFGGNGYWVLPDADQPCPKYVLGEPPDHAQNPDMDHAQNPDTKIDPLGEDTTTPKPPTPLNDAKELEEANRKRIHAEAVALVDRWFRSYEAIIGSKCPYEGRKYMGYLGMMKTLLGQYPKEEIEKRMDGALRHEYLTGIPGSIYDFKEGFGKYVDTNRPGKSGQQVRREVVL